MTHPHTDDVPPTIAARGAPRPESRPDDDGPGSPARRRGLRPAAVAVVLVLSGLSLALMIAPAGLVVVLLGVGVGVWAALGGGERDDGLSRRPRPH